MGKHTKFQSQYQDAYGNQDQGQKFGHDQIQNQNQNALGTQQIGQSVDGRLQVAGQEAGGRQNMNQADNIMKKVKHPPPSYAPPEYAPTYRGLKSYKLGFGGGKIFPGLWQNNFFNPHAALPIFQMGKHTKFQSQYQDAYGNQDQGQKFGHD